MKSLMDFKYVVMLIVTLASVAVPVWLWRADLQARSLQFQLLSSTSIASPAIEGLPGVEIVVNGRPLQSPFVSLLKLEHRGTRPIPATDFESGPELRVNGGISIVRALPVASEPPELQAKLETDTVKVTVAPMLLNPGDSITLSVITSGGRPQFSTRGRIAGVASVSLQEAPLNRYTLMQTLILLLISFVGLVVATMNMNLKPEPGYDVYLRGRASFLAFFVSLGVGVIPMFEVIGSFGYSAVWQNVVATMLLFVPARFVGNWWNARRG